MCIYNVTPIFHLILGLNYAYIFPGVGTYDDLMSQYDGKLTALVETYETESGTPRTQVLPPLRLSGQFWSILH